MSHNLYHNVAKWAVRFSALLAILSTNVGYAVAQFTAAQAARALPIITQSQSPALARQALVQAFSGSPGVAEAIWAQGGKALYDALQSGKSTSRLSSSDLRRLRVMGKSWHGTQVLQAATHLTKNDKGLSYTLIRNWIQTSSSSVPAPRPKTESKQSALAAVSTFECNSTQCTTNLNNILTGVGPTATTARNNLALLNASAQQGADLCSTANRGQCLKDLTGALQNVVGKHPDLLRSSASVQFMHNIHTRALGHNKPSEIFLGHRRATSKMALPPSLTRCYREGT